MSWLQRIRDNLKIITGDGREYFPNWLNATKAKEYNVAQFEFLNVPGTLVSRGTRKGNKYNLEIYFQGENHLDTAEAFDNSADDPRPWVLFHPFYGRVVVQPLSIAQDNSEYNVSKFSIPIVETIEQNNPRVTVDPVDSIKEVSTSALTNLQVSFEFNPPEALDIPPLLADVDRLYNRGIKNIRLTIDSSEYLNTYRRTYAAVSNAVAEPLAAIREIQTMINAPALFVDSVKNRVDSLIFQFNGMRESLVNITTVFDRRRYEQVSGALICTMCLASITNRDYRNRREVVEVVDKIVDAYDNYISDLDGLQGDNGGNPDSFIPDQSSLINISDTVNQTISQLFEISLGAKQERTIYLEDDSNVVLLAHRFYGLDQEDSNIQRIIDDNNIGLNELLQIKKGRAIVYTT